MTSKKSSKSPLQVGNNVLIRTVTLYHTGRIVEVNDHEIVLEDAAWIPDVGRFNEAVRDGAQKLAEVEPFVSPVAIGRGAICDVTLWPGELPRGVK